MTTHKHKCGLHVDAGDRDASDPPLTVQGCGYEWEHEQVFITKDDYNARHACPRCGAGPWLKRVLPPEVEKLADFLEANLPRRAPVVELVVIELGTNELNRERDMEALNAVLRDVRSIATLARALLPPDHPFHRRQR